MRTRTILLAAMPPLLLLLLATWRLAGPAPIATVPASPIATATGRAAVRTPLPPLAEAPPRPASAPAARASQSTDLASRVDAWAQSSDPADAMRAYDAVLECLIARRDERRPTEEVARERHTLEQALPLEQREHLRRHWRTSATQCGNLRSDQVQRRMQWLARAAQAGVPLAAIQFINEGPDGNGAMQDEGVPRPPLTDAWRAARDAYVEAALRRCDTGLVGYLGTQAAGDAQDFSQALDFWQAHVRCQGGPDPGPLGDDPVAVRRLHDLGSPEAFHAARVVG